MVNFVKYSAHAQIFADASMVILRLMLVLIIGVNSFLHLDHRLPDTTSYERVLDHGCMNTVCKTSGFGIYGFRGFTILGLKLKGICGLRVLNSSCLRLLLYMSRVPAFIICETFNNCVLERIFIIIRSKYILFQQDVQLNAGSLNSET